MAEDRQAHQGQVHVQLACRVHLEAHADQRSAGRTPKKESTSKSAQLHCSGKGIDGPGLFPLSLFLISTCWSSRKVFPIEWPTTWPHQSPQSNNPRTHHWATSRVPSWPLWKNSTLMGRQSFLGSTGLILVQPFSSMDSRSLGLNGLATRGQRMIQYPNSQGAISKVCYNNQFM